VVLEAYTDPNVPPLPPHITLKQAKNFTESIFRDPDMWSMIKETWKEEVATLFHK
jgi:pyruvate dehydrogenase (quinone)